MAQEISLEVIVLSIYYLIEGLLEFNGLFYISSMNLIVPVPVHITIKHPLYNSRLDVVRISLSQTHVLFSQPHPFQSIAMAMEFGWE